MATWIDRSALAAALVLGLLAAPAQAQDGAVIKRATELRESPTESSASLGALAADSSVARTGERKGSWVKVRTSQGTAGWVHMFDVGAQSGAAPASGNAATGGLRSLGGLFGGNSGSTTTATSTVGIRGLGAEDIANAQPNPAAVSQAEKLRVNADQARQFAGTAALRAQNVEPLPEPPRPTPTGSGGQINPDTQSAN